MPDDSETTRRRRIAHIKDEIVALGPLRPGTLTRQFNVCGTPGCRCKEDPAQRHGPYPQLSYTWNGKSRSEFVREEEIARVEEQLRNYMRLRSLVNEWIGIAIEQARTERQKLRYPQANSQPKARIAKKKHSSRI